MRNKYKFTFLLLLLLAMAFFAILFLFSIDIVVLSPKGWVGIKERDLILTVTWVMLIIVIPVLVLTFFIAWKYRASNTKAKYDPDWGHHPLAEVIWWGLPCLIILALSIITWKGCHELDPFKPIVSKNKTMKIQVVALDWKWLFIYPEQNIASVNFFQIPEQTPIYFEITSDAPMNSFWLPELGGQVFAMSGMKTKLHLIADQVGSFRGSSANISGKGFSGMTFIAKASSEVDFHEWVKSVKQSSAALTLEEYLKLAQPSEYNPVSTYVLGEEALFDWIVMKYMMPNVDLKSLRK